MLENELSPSPSFCIRAATIGSERPHLQEEAPQGATLGHLTENGNLPLCPWEKWQREAQREAAGFFPPLNTVTPACTDKTGMATSM